MTVGLGVLRLSPAAFWAMTPKELAAAAAAFAPGGEGPIGRGRLGELMGRFPDGRS
jgi:uncharacterized phage protein (TIGR02216 family)